MYCNFFGFSEKPFDVTPDPKFLYLTPGHGEMLASLTYGIRERRGFITIGGEVGTGKTTLLNAVLDRLDEKTRVAYIFNRVITFDQMLATALADLGLAGSNESLSEGRSGPSAKRLCHPATRWRRQCGNEYEGQHGV